jgi:elongation factor Ts
MQISSEMIKTLRDRTGAGMMDCKNALVASDGNIESAVEHLRKKGAAVAQKRADRSAKEGMIVTRVSPDGTRGVILEVNSETDFVGRSEDFVRFAGQIAETLEAKQPASMAALHAATTADGKTVEQVLNDVLAKVGEKVNIRRFTSVVSQGGRVSAYTHLGNKIGVLVDLAGADEHEAAGRNVAMQIAAMNPLVISRDQIQKAVIDRELEIYRTQATNEGKPSQVVDRIANGKLEKFFQEVCLLEQTFIKDPGKTVREYLQAAGEGLMVKSFTRYHLGEEITEPQ